MSQGSRATRAPLVLALLAVLCLVVSTACVACVSERAPLDEPEHKTAVAQAKEEGIQIYWLGDEFPAGPLVLRITAGTEFNERPGGSPGIELTYDGQLEKGSVGLDIESFAADGDGPEVVRQAALAVRGATTETIRVGSRDAELFVLPISGRPVNQLWLIMDVGDSTIVAQAASGDTGLPETDVNPLIQADLLASVLDQYLQPYPY